jgi:hypothetical protein
MNWLSGGLNFNTLIENSAKFLENLDDVAAQQLGTKSDSEEERMLFVNLDSRLTIQMMCLKYFSNFNNKRNRLHCLINPNRNIRRSSSTRPMNLLTQKRNRTRITIRASNNRTPTAIDNNHNQADQRCTALRRILIPLQHRLQTHPERCR